VPASADPSLVLVDTSVAVALSLADHEHHGIAVDALRGRSLGLSGHAAFETFSVLTRLPGPSRRSPRVIAELLEKNFPETRYLSAKASKALMSMLRRGGVAGGSIYDALVGAAAKEHAATLVTLDARALDTYRVTGVDVDLLSHS